MSNTEDNTQKVFHELLVSDRNGQYIPQIFCQHVLADIVDQQSDDIKAAIAKLAKEDSNEDEWYWEDWQLITDNMKWMVDGVTYSLYQNGDLWSINDDELNKLTEEECEAIFNY